MKIRVRDVVNATADELGIDRKSFRSESRVKELAKARQIAAGLSKRLVECSTPQIGKELGKDHTTIMHSICVAKIDDELAEKVRQRARLLADNFWRQFESGVYAPRRGSIAVCTSPRRLRQHQDGVWSVHG